jgi:antitoxin (DNA-binding transcriptional repressor) of toxin-antitoxin stability system
MSQAPRTLGEADVYVRRYTSRRERRRAMRNLILLITAVAGGWFFWVTRDNWPVARLVPKDPAFQICAMDLLMNRKEIAASRVWDLAPPNTGVKEARTALSGNFGLPEWMINNLMNGLGLISGADLRDPESAIFVTRISRIARDFPRLRQDHRGRSRRRARPAAREGRRCVLRHPRTRAGCQPQPRRLGACAHHARGRDP